MLQNRLHGDVDCSILCTTHKEETWFGFNYLQFMGLYSKCPELAFNQWVAGSSPARLIPIINHLQSRIAPAFSVSPTFSPTTFIPSKSQSTENPEFFFDRPADMAYSDLVSESGAGFRLRPFFHPRFGLRSGF